jgi:transitional endoplasmic reticulum ATPase
MAHGDDAIRALREALRHSPDNLPLRLHLADTLAGLGRFDDAEAEYKSAIEAAPRDPAPKLGLADAYYRGGKASAAMVVVEELAKLQNPPAKAFLLMSKLLFKAGDVSRAVRQYKRAVEADESLADAEYAEQLGVRDEPKFDPSGRDDGAAFGSPDREVVDGRVRSSSGGDPGAGGDVPVERPKISFKDVGGMEGLKDEIRMKIIHPLTHAELYKAYGKAVGGGILMYGPPGCGKTHIARATAGEIKAAFISIGINDVLDMWLGNSERNLHALFDKARRSKPCVLFFDEVDALAASRADMRHSGARHLINQFLSELDGVTASNDGVLILAATNAPWSVDPAFRRPGRFDRILFVPPPDAESRADVVRLHLAGKPTKDVDPEQIARKTDGFSGADLKAVVDLAIEAKLKEAMRDGVPKPITTKDLLAAAGQVRGSTKEWFGTARNYALYSNQGGTYDDILKYLKL